MFKKTLLLIVPLALLGAGCIATEPETVAVNEGTPEEAAIAVAPGADSDDAAALQDAVEESEKDDVATGTDPVDLGDVDEATSESSAVVDYTPGTYMEYSEGAIATAAVDGDVVLFFHASWCPSCKALDKSITGQGIPDGITILKVDYDTERDLKKKYGVTYQHTLVQVDANGELIAKWSGGNTLQSIIDRVE